MRENQSLRAASLMPGIRTGRAPFARATPARATRDVQHRALVTHQQPQQLDESRAVKGAGRAIGRRLYREGIAHARDGQSLLAPELRAEHRARRATRRRVTEEPGRALRGEA